MAVYLYSILADCILSINAVYDTRRQLLAKLQTFFGFLKKRFGPKP